MIPKYAPLRKSLLYVVLLVVSGFATAPAESWKPDPGTPDTVWLPSVDWRGDTLFAVDVFTATDESLAVAQIVIAWPNRAMRFDSANLNLGRWAVSGYSAWTQAGVDTAVALAFLPTQKRLPPGSGIVAKAFFGRDSAYTFDSDANLDTTQIYPPVPLAPYQVVFSQAANDPFLPSSVQVGTVAFRPCFCTQHGDVVEDGALDVLDLSQVIDGLFAGAEMPTNDYDCPHIHRGDYNCDNTYDILDLNHLIDHIFFGGPGPCDPCADL